MPTPRNLAGAPSGVNNFGGSEYPNARSENSNVPTPEVTSMGLQGTGPGRTAKSLNRLRKNLVLYQGTTLVGP
jgi:hypothetical protein